MIENTSTEDQSVNPSSPSPKVEEEEEDSLKPSTLPADNISSLVSPGGSTFDYLYEFSETRKVLEEFFKCPAPTKEKENNIESFPFQVSFLFVYDIRYICTYIHIRTYSFNILFAYKILNFEEIFGKKKRSRILAV